MKTVLITGATDGIGKQTAYDLFRKGFNVIIHGRDLRKAEETAESLKKQPQQDKGSSPEVFTVTADLSLVKNMPDLADQVKGLPVKPDILINNAGVFMNERVITEEGFEMTFAVNHLSHFALTLLLLQDLSESDDPRIVNVSSIAHSGKSVDLKNLDLGKKFDGYSAYAMSKAANILFTKELARRVKTHADFSRITVNALHPGVVNTKLLQTGFGSVGRESLKEGAATSVYLAADEKIKGVTGRYFLACREHRPSAHADDPVLAEQFFDLSIKLCNQAGAYVSDIL